jgi:hypothetical protein|tara:strand:+ start:3432 stop:3713 length:282 start_codon:yes stop_codon:yes gene_type:complete
MKLPRNYDQLTRKERRLTRLEYIRVQEGKCAHCNEPLGDSPTDKVAQAKINEELFPKGFLDNPIHLHHNHDTGLTIGAVHCRCNAYLWEYLGE